jgi:hypothetical protein
VPAFQEAPAAALSGAEDVYQGPEVYQGPDVYQGPEHVYQGPVSGSSAAARRTPGGAPEGDSMLRATLVGAIAGALAVFIWYEVALSTGREFGILALLAGAMVGFGTRIGAGGGSPGAGKLAAFILLVSMFIGEFLIIKHFVDTFRDPSALAEESAIEYDCNFTLDEARQLVGKDEDEWDALEGLEQRSWKRAVETECREDTGEISSDEDVGLVDHEPFSIGEFVAGSLGYFGVMGLVFLFIGAGEAYKIASTEGA